MARLEQRGGCSGIEHQQLQEEATARGIKVAEEAEKAAKEVAKDEAKAAQKGAR